MPIVSCPTCGRRYDVPKEEVGAPVHCGDCARSFVAEKPKPEPTRRREHDDYDREDLPPRRSERFQPHRGGLVLVMGILAVVPVGGVGLITGILAWVWGNEDLKKMDAGVMDPEGRANTQLGKVLGIIGTILHGVGLLIALAAMCFAFLIPLFMVGAISAMPTGPKTPTSASRPPRPAPKPSTAPTKTKNPKSSDKKTSLHSPRHLADYLPSRWA